MYADLKDTIGLLTPVTMLQVQKPTKEQEQATKMTHGKVFVVYFGTMEIEAVTHRCIQPWSAMVAPTAPQGSLKAALDLAKDLAPDSTVV